MKNVKRYNRLLNRLWLNAKSNRQELLFYNCRFVDGCAANYSRENVIEEMIPIKNIRFFVDGDFAGIHLQNGYLIHSHWAYVNPHSGIEELDRLTVKMQKVMMRKHGHKFA